MMWIIGWGLAPHQQYKEAGTSKATDTGGAPNLGVFTQTSRSQRNKVTVFNSNDKVKADAQVRLVGLTWVRQQDRRGVVLKGPTEAELIEERRPSQTV